MRTLFTIFGSLAALSVLGLIASVLTETLSGYKNFVFSGSELTVNFSGIDRILLSFSVIFVFTAFCLWMKVSGRD
jgi:hypothetical protein